MSRIPVRVKSGGSSGGAEPQNTFSYERDSHLLSPLASMRSTMPISTVGRNTIRRRSTSSLPSFSSYNIARDSAISRIKELASPATSTSALSSLLTKEISFYESLPKEQPEVRNRRRAEVYAVNRYLKSIEEENFTLYYASCQKIDKNGDRQLEDESVSSGNSSLCSAFDQSLLISKRGPRFNKKPPMKSVDSSSRQKVGSLKMNDSRPCNAVVGAV